MAANTYTMENPVFKAFMQYAALVILKTMVMSFLTAIQRFSNKAFANEEDVASFKGKVNVKTHESVERVRRCHLNDLENVIPFVLLGFLYVATGPSLWAALLHFRVFTIARYLHTIVYIGRVPQPARGISFIVGVVVCVSMGVNVLQNGTL